MPKVPYVLFTRDKLQKNGFKFTTEVGLVLREAGIPLLNLIDDDYPSIRSFGHAHLVFCKSSVKIKLESLTEFQKFRGLEFGDRITFFTQHVAPNEELHFKVKRRNERGEWGLVRPIGRRQQERPQNQPPPAQDPPAPPQEPLAPVQELPAPPRLLKPRQDPRLASSSKTAKAATRSAASTTRLLRRRDPPPPPQCAQQDPPPPPQPLTLPQELPAPPAPPQEPLAPVQELPAPPRLLKPRQDPRLASSSKTAKAATRSAASTTRLLRRRDPPPPPQCAQQDPPPPPQPLTLPQELPAPPAPPRQPTDFSVPSTDLPLVPDWEKVIDRAINEMAEVIKDHLKGALKAIFRR